MTKRKSSPSARPGDAAAALAGLLPGIANILYRLTHGLGCPDELSLPQLKSLQFIHAAGRALKMSELSRMLGIASSTLTETVKKLAADGYLSRERSPEDDRVVLLALTAKGRRLIDTHLKNLHKFFTMVCAEAGPKGSAELLKAHQFIHATYKAILDRQDGASKEEEEA